jgi:hypothetical protein
LVLLRALRQKYFHNMIAWNGSISWFT